MHPLRTPANPCEHLRAAAAPSTNRLPECSAIFKSPDGHLPTRTAAPHLTHGFHSEFDILFPHTSWIVCPAAQCVPCPPDFRTLDSKSPLLVLLLGKESSLLCICAVAGSYSTGIRTALACYCFVEKIPVSIEHCDESST